MHMPLAPCVHACACQRSVRLTKLSVRSPLSTAVCHSVRARLASGRTTTGREARKRGKRGPTPFQTKPTGRLSFSAPRGPSCPAILDPPASWRTATRREATHTDAGRLSHGCARPNPRASLGFCDDWTGLTPPPTMGRRGMLPLRDVARGARATDSGVWKYIWIAVASSLRALGAALNL